MEFPRKGRFRCSSLMRPILTKYNFSVRWREWRVPGHVHNWDRRAISSNEGKLHRHPTHPRNRITHTKVHCLSPQTPENKIPESYYSVGIILGSVFPIKLSSRRWESQSSEAIDIICSIGKSSIVDVYHLYSKQETLGKFGTTPITYDRFLINKTGNEKSQTVIELEVTVVSKSYSNQ